MADKREIVPDELESFRDLQSAPLPSVGEDTLRQLVRPAREGAQDILTASHSEIVDAAMCVSVADASLFPFAAVACLRINLGEGSPRRGTAFFINDHVLLTAGHNVEFDGDTVTSIDVMPGLNGAGFLINTTLFEPAANYRRHHMPEFDYGVIFLPNGASNLFFGLRVATDSELSGLPVRLQGYPSDDLMQRDCHGTVGSIAPSLFSYDIPTNEGESGAPVWFVEDRHAIVVGIHIGELRDQPVARRFTSDSASEVRAWSAMHG